MDRSECKRIVDEHIVALKEAFGVPHWTIHVRYEAPSGPDGPDNWRATASCAVRPEYEQAGIMLDPDAYEPGDADAVLSDLRHELMHVVLAPFDLYRGFATAFIESGTTADAQEDTIWTHAVEQGARSLERLWHGAERYWRERIAAEPKAGSRPTPPRRTRKK